jgi:hypothetical protein
MNNWEKLCKLVKPLIEANVIERTLHQSFEEWLEVIFNWDAASIEHNVPVQSGTETKFADTVLHGSDFGIVIEMKRPDKNLDEFGEQLFSYMRYLGCKYGLLIGKEIRMFYDEKKDAPLAKAKEVVRFPFNSRNADGIQFSEIMEKSFCSDEKLKEYAIQRINRPNPVIDSNIDIEPIEQPKQGNDAVKPILKSDNNRIDKFEKIMDQYDSISPHQYKTTGTTGTYKDWIYREIVFNDFPGSLYYALVMVNSDWLEIRIQNDYSGDQTEINRIIESHEGLTIGQYTAFLRGRKKRRLIFEVPITENIKTIAEITHTLIDNTRGELSICRR